MIEKNYRNFKGAARAMAFALILSLSLPAMAFAGEQPASGTSFPGEKPASGTSFPGEQPASGTKVVVSVKQAKLGGQVGTIDIKKAENLVATSSAVAPKVLTPVALTFEGALKQMEDSPQMKLIKIQALGDKAAATGSNEGMKDLRDAENNIESLRVAAQADPTLQPAYWAAVGSYDSSKFSQVRIRTNFVYSILEANDTARKNSLNLKILDTYYGVKNVEEREKIARDNCEISKSLYETTLSKYKLGVVSKMDLLSAETEYQAAKDGLMAASNGLAQAKMGLNMFFGYGLDQEVQLITQMTEPTLPAIKLDQAVAKAMENRLEVKEAKNNLELAQENLKEYYAYPKNSSRYLGAEAKVLSAQTAVDIMPARIQKDVRTKHMTMMEKYQAVQSGKKAVENANEVYRLAKLQYDKGVTVLTVPQKAQLGVAKAKTDYSTALLELYKSIEDFNYSYGVGVEAVGF